MSTATRLPIGALRVLRRENSGWSVLIRSRRYLNNIVEQDHGAIKQRCVTMLALKSLRTAAITLAGLELAHRIRKGSSHSAAMVPVVSHRSSICGRAR